MAAIFFLVNKAPRHSAAGVSAFAGIMFLQPTISIFRATNVISIIA
jgi:hypothetical protein